MQRHRTHRWHNQVFFPHVIYNIKKQIKNEINQRYIVQETAFYKESQELLQNFPFRLICTAVYLIQNTHYNIHHLTWTINKT